MITGGAHAPTARACVHRVLGPALLSGGGGHLGGHMDGLVVLLAR